MPPVHRANDICTGHGCFPPRKTTSWSSITFANNLGIHRKGDSYGIHCCGTPCHPGTGQSGSSTVIVENQNCRRIGDPVSCGGVAAVGSPNIIVGG